MWFVLAELGWALGQAEKREAWETRLMCSRSSKKRGFLFLWQEVDTEHQHRGRRDPVVRSQMEHSRSCSIRNRVPRDS